jgi:hypothetical protein
MTGANAQIVKRDRPGIRQEIAIIPPWAFVMAAIMLLLAPILFVTFAAEGPLPFRLLVSLLPATILAFLFLMIGYVNRDAGRRGMSRTLWTFIVIIVPNAIGFILYFLLRNPVQAECPKCQAVVNPNMNYCPNCRYSFHPMCAQCKKAVGPNDMFCANCGTELERHA